MGEFFQTQLETKELRTTQVVNTLCSLTPTVTSNSNVTLAVLSKSVLTVCASQWFWDFRHLNLRSKLHNKIKEAVYMHIYFNFESLCIRSAKVS